MAAATGWWESDGGVAQFGDAKFLGGMSGTTLGGPVVGLAPTPLQSSALPPAAQSIYAIDSTGNAWQNNWTGTAWSGWSSLGNGGVSLVGGIAAGYNYVKNADLFATGANGSVYQDWWTGTAWSGWQSMGNGGSSLSSGVAAGINQSNNANIFATGANGAVWQSWWTGTAWSGWQSMGNGGSSLSSGVAAGVNQSNNANIFATGANGAVWQSLVDGDRMVRLAVDGQRRLIVV